MPRSWGPRLVVLGIALAITTAGACRGDDGSDPPSGTTTTTSGEGGAGGEGGGGGSGGEGGLVLSGDPLKVVTWNVRNYFDTIDSAAIDGDDGLSFGDYQAKRAAVGAVLRALDPDVAVLQEVENLGILTDLDQQELGGAYPNRALIDANDQRGIDIGALSKVPFDQVVSHAGDSFTLEGTNGPIYEYARDAVELHLTVGERKIVLIGVHFRSKNAPDDPDKRLAEAQHTRAIADELTAADPTVAIAILGDFNDLPGSPPLLAIQGSGEGAYDNAAMLAPEADRWSFNYNGMLELVDHQMVNPVLRARLDEASVTILHGPEIDDASDHAPVMVTYYPGTP